MALNPISSLSSPNDVKLNIGQSADAKREQAATNFCTVKEEDQPKPVDKDQPQYSDIKANINNEKNFANTFYSTLGNSKAINYHKSLDFSNVGTYTEKEGNELQLAFRQFHQTRIYVSGFDCMLRHGVKGDNAKYLISANLPDFINYSIGSMWEAPLTGLGTSAGSALLGLAKSGMLESGNKTTESIASFMPDSLVNRAQTILLWNGAKPLNMSITIPVLDDGSFNKTSSIGGKYIGKENGVNTNLAEALEFLGSLCLPSYIASESDISKKNDPRGKQKWGFYKPPPSPLNVKLKGYSYKKDPVSQHYTPELDTKTEISGTFTQTYGRIMIQLGGMLLIDNCIITGITVKYTNTKSLIRHHYDARQNNKNNLDYLVPMIAEVTINFSTIEAITANVYSKMLWGIEQKEMGAGEINLGGAQYYLEEIRKFLAGIAKEEEVKQ